MQWNAPSKGEVLVIDDDAISREALSSILRPEGYEMICFADGAALQAQARARMPACIFIEVGRTDRSAFDILRKLRAENCPAPIFATSGDGDISLAVDAIKGGAWDFIEKPYGNDDVIDRIDSAIEEHARPKNGGIPGLSLHVPGCEPLTRREREVLARIALGETNKHVARELGLSARTIEGYRASIMRKIGARNATDLVRRVFSESRQDR